ncbi:D-alanine--D-alanine ligase [Conexibacter sp. DBS9H8]|uniref:D-alanine--D-alanine ligase family protein n=1 Tax=Conexibacter sp. DBS9H8 TaxID=2937801 RepID=UPI00200F397F|nr:D-alanine--D-alanine ligase [Conexibacter sp. DBS9H8]
MSHVAVLKGGRSLERQVSLKSAARVEESLRRLGHRVSAIDVGADLVTQLTASAPDLAFIVLHGRDGEDGTVQELLDVLGVPYTGSRASACAVAGDKVAAKRALRRAGLPTPAFFAFTEGAFQALGAGQALGALERHLGFPIVVKPAAQGSALGIRFAHSAAELPTALIAAFSYDRTVLLERFIAGRDLAVGIIDGADGGQALPVVEALPEAGPDRPGTAYDYESRYEIGRTRFCCPAELPDALAERAQEIALAVYRELGCGGFGRVDLMLEEATGELAVLELNPIPGLTETSLLPIAADAAGVGFDELVETILAAVWAPA